VIAAACRHDIPLRLFNVRGTGERHAYAHLLLETIMKDAGCPKKLVMIFNALLNCSLYFMILAALSRNMWHHEWIRKSFRESLLRSVFSIYMDMASIVRLDFPQGYYLRSG
jgi:hypothetical protein